MVSLIQTLPPVWRVTQVALDVVLVSLRNSLTSTGFGGCCYCGGGCGRNGLRLGLSLRRRGERRPRASRAVARLAPGAAPLRTHSGTPNALLRLHYAAASNSIESDHSFLVYLRNLQGDLHKLFYCNQTDTISRV